MNSDNMEIEPAHIAQILREEIHEETVKGYCGVNQHPLKHDRPWTVAIFDTLGRLVRERGGYAVYTNPKEQEFMLDFVWLDRNDEGRVRRAVLGVESEWSSTIGEVARDFYKLLCFKAKLKVLIYQIPKRAPPEKFRKVLCDCLKAFEFHVAGESYLFIEFYLTAEDIWKQNSLVFRVEQDGVAQSVALSPLPCRTL